VPLYIAGPADTAFREQLVQYSLIVTLNTQVQPARPPVNTELIRGETSIALLRNGLTIGQMEKKNISEINRNGILHVVSDFIEGNEGFYQRLTADINR
jgi:hypothetical protein